MTVLIEIKYPKRESSQSFCDLPVKPHTVFISTCDTSLLDMTLGL